MAEGVTNKKLVVDGQDAARVVKGKQQTVVHVYQKSRRRRREIHDPNRHPLDCAPPTQQKHERSKSWNTESKDEI